MPARGKRAGIPAPVGVQDPAVERILWAMRERLEGDAATTTATRRGGAIPGGTGGSGTTDNPVRPLAPEKLVATGIFGAIILELSRIPPGAAYVEWLAATENDIGQAAVVGTSVVPIWRHYVGANVGRYYWARGVGYGAAELRGPLSEMVYAESAKDPKFLKEQLDQQLEKSQLAQALAEEINLITAPASTVGSPAYLDEQIRSFLQGGTDLTIADVDSAIETERDERIADVQQTAQTAADNLLGERLTRESEISRVETQSQSGDESLAEAVATVAAGTGEQFDHALIWFFDEDLESWTGGTAAVSYIRPNNGTGYITSPTGLGITASRYRYIKTMIRHKGDPAWAGELEWRETGDSTWHGPATIAEPEYQSDGDATIGWNDIPWAGEIDQIRIRLAADQTDTDYIEADWIAVGRPTPGASVAGLRRVDQASINRDSANTLARETLAAQMRGEYDGTDPAQLTQGLLFQQREATATQFSAQAERLDVVEGQSSDNSASITELARSQTDAEQASATRDSLIEAQFTAVDLVLAPGQEPSPATKDIIATARIAREETTRAGETFALGQRTDVVEARLKALRLVDTFGFEEGEVGQTGAPRGWTLTGAGEYRPAIDPDSEYGSVLSYRLNGPGALDKTFAVEGGDQFEVSVPTRVDTGHGYVLLTLYDGNGQMIEQVPSPEASVGYDGTLTVSHLLPADARFVGLSLRASAIAG